MALARGAFALYLCVLALLSLLSLLLLSLSKLLSWCNCKVCRTYLTKSWVSQFSNLCDFYTHLLKSSKTQTIKVHVLNNIITANPKNVEHILKTQFENYPKGKPFHTILHDLLGRGIFNVDGELWRFQRKMASYELGSQAVRAMVAKTVLAEIETRLEPILADSVSKGSKLDLQDVLKKFTFDNICKISFGLDPCCLELTQPISEFAQAFDRASHLCAGRAVVAPSLIWKIKKFLNLGSERSLREAINMVDLMAIEVIRQRKEVGSEASDLLSRFMTTVSDDKFLRDIIVSFLLAGRDTVASALTGFFWLMAKHPEVEEKVHDEIVRVMGKGVEREREEGGAREGESGVERGERVSEELRERGKWGRDKEEREGEDFRERKEVIASYGKLREMHYLHAALSESMRLYPPVQFDSKFAEKDDILPDGTVVKKGTRVTYHPYAMGRMESIWGKDCMEFNPERWLENGFFVPENPFKYPVFQAGLRVCLGKEMAFLQMKSVVASVVYKHKLVLVNPDYTPRFVTSLTANVSGGLEVFVESRS
ncbi:hypothetical protein AMTRI_Chr11g150630 [Amborella trichopoda]